MLIQKRDDYELKISLNYIAELKKLFPVMDILESNHGSLVYRKAKTNGIPRHYLKSYNDVLGVDDKWKWHFELTVNLPKRWRFKKEPQLNRV